jgi:hypothetical protein
LQNWIIDNNQFQLTKKEEAVAQFNVSLHMPEETEKNYENPHGPGGIDSNPVLPKYQTAVFSLEATHSVTEMRREKSITALLQ